MCFSGPKPPKVYPDTELLRQQEEARSNAAADRALAKARRTGEAAGQVNGLLGRASLFSGQAGGAGFGQLSARSLFVPNGR